MNRNRDRNDANDLDDMDEMNDRNDMKADGSRVVLEERFEDTIPGVVR